MTTIIHSSGVITPLAVEGYRASRRINNVFHDIANRADRDVTFRPAGLRVGTFRLVFDNEPAAMEAFAVLASSQAFTINNPDIDSLNMTFVAGDGDLDIEQDADVVNVFRVLVPFEEVAP